MKLSTCRQKATVLTMATDGSKVFSSFFTGETMNPLWVMPYNILVQPYFLSIIMVADKVVNVKWGGT
jgi:hypothetical protein